MMRRNAHLINQTADIVHRIVRSGIKLMDIKRGIIIKRNTRLASVTRLDFVGKILAIDRLCQDACTGSFANTSRACKQKRLCQLIIPNGVFERSRYVILPHHGGKSIRPILAC